MPTVVRLVRYVVTRWRYTAGPAWSRSGVLLRDGRRCGYCAGHGMTVDHILPRSRGGRNTWLNTMAACEGCNQRKGDRTRQRPAWCCGSRRRPRRGPPWLGADRGARPPRITFVEKDGPPFPDRLVGRTSRSERGRLGSNPSPGAPRRPPRVRLSPPALHAAVAQLAEHAPR